MAKCRFYVPRIEFAKCDSSTIWAANSYGMELFDYNPNTWVKGDGIYTQPHIQLDADKSGNVVTWDVTFCGLYFCNMDKLVTDGGRIQVYSTQDPAYGAPNQIWRGTRYFSSNTADQPMMVCTFTATRDKYWLIEIITNSIIPKVSMWLIGSSHDLGVRWDFGTADGLRTFSDQQDIGGGRTFSRLYSSRQSRVAGRPFENLGSTDLAALRAAHQAALGAHAPLIYVDEDLSANLYPHEGILARFGSNVLGESSINYGLWNVNLSLTELMQMTAGRAY